MSTHDWILFATATLALNLTPGPDMLYISARSVAQGRRAGVLSALGVAGGGAVHTCLVAFGLAGLLARVPIAYDVVRYAGAAYLIYLGARLLFESPTGAARPTVAESGRRTFAQGLVTNVLNPKVALFFLAFLPQFADPARGALWWQFLILGAWFNLSGTLANLIVALVASTGRRLALGRSRSSRWLRSLSAAVFVGLGARLALASNR
jgi:threonine/homoserine/homoserine lactone efflux protein